jgi:hypothetical protein
MFELLDPPQQAPAKSANANSRRMRGLEIAALCQIEEKEDCYLVPSQSQPKKYTVKYWKGVPSCNCPDSRRLHRIWSNSGSATTVFNRRKIKIPDRASGPMSGIVAAFFFQLG